MTHAVDPILGPGGLIAQRLPEYEERPQQLLLARAVEEALRERRHLIAEAGTGVGKSFAYLLPAVLHSCQHAGMGPVVVATRTIALQGQLERKDLPFLHQVLPLEWSSVTAVGRNHYLCLRRMHLALAERRTLFPDHEHERQLAEVAHWSSGAREGLRMELPAPVDDAVWDEVRAEHGNCLHRACPYFEPCGYQRARRRMEGAQILVVNHALYLADVALRIAGARYLPEHEVVIFDEAHHLESAASEALGLRCARASVGWHLRRLRGRDGKGLLHAYGSPAARSFADAVAQQGERLFAELDERLGATAGDTLALDDQKIDSELPPALAALAGELFACAQLQDSLDVKMELTSRCNGLSALSLTVQALCQGSEQGHVRWLERGKSGAELKSAPLDVSRLLAAHVFTPQRSCILVSATLGVGGDDRFSWLRSRLGIGDAQALRLGSPFDFRRQMRLVLEDALPDPSRDAESFQRESLPRIERHLLANGGHALVLCTSWQAVRAIAQSLRPVLAEHGIPLLVQGDAPLVRLLEEKRRAPGSVLLGTDSLWEGIDVPGDALTLVIVTKFPFQAPGHPLTKARLRAVETNGGNGFLDHTLPEAIVKFRQGIGRLIRTHQDRGKVVILDPRIRTRHYGRLFLEALPEGVAVEEQAAE